MPTFFATNTKTFTSHSNLTFRFFGYECNDDFLPNYLASPISTDKLLRTWGEFIPVGFARDAQVLAFFITAM